MGFQWSAALALLALLPLLAFLYVRLEHRRRLAALRYASEAMVARAVAGGPGRLRHLAPAIYLGSLALLLIALARPFATVTVADQRGTVILLMDASGSMRTPDIQPSRSAAAAAAATLFVEKQRGNDRVRIGVVSFAEQAAVVLAPTLDRDAAILAIRRLQLQRGTAIGDGILTALDAIFEETADELPSEGFAARAAGRPAGRASAAPAPAAATIILLTDGANTRPPTPLDVVEEAVSRGVRINTVGVGTPNAVSGFGFGRFARFDETMLRKIAELTDGEYFSAASAADLTRIYERLGSDIVFHSAKTELGVVFTGLGVLLAFVAAGFSLTLFGRLP